jgi:hypothetical protein
LPEQVAVRSLEQVKAEIVERRRRGKPAALPVVELARPDVRRVCDFLRWHVRFGDDVPAVVVSGEIAEYEVVVREAGAALFVASPREVDVVVGLVERYQADEPNRVGLARDDQRTWLEQIRDRLPWGTK